jgi:hypothetical protein
MVGNFQFNYTFNNSNDAIVLYKVIKFGIDGPLRTSFVFVNRPTILLTADRIRSLINNSEDKSNIQVEVKLLSGNAPTLTFNADAIEDYPVNISTLGRQTVIVSFTYEGETISISKNFTVFDMVTPTPPTPPPVPNRISGETLIISGAIAIVIILLILFLIS